MKTIIAPAYQHDNLTKKILEEEKILMDIRLLPLQGFLDDLFPNQSGYELAFLKALKQLDNKLEILSPYLLDQSFQKELQEFHLAIKLYQINLDDLPITNKKDQELKVILEAIDHLIPDQYQQLLQLKESKFNFENVYISEHFYKHDFEQIVIDYLLKFGAQKLEDNYQQLENIEVYYANNKRAEIESAAQYLIKNKLDLNQCLLVPLDKEYLSLIPSIFSRYHIPLQFSEKKLTQTSLEFIDLVNLLHKQDHQSLINFLASNPLELKIDSEIIDFIKHHQFDLDDFLSYQYLALESQFFFKADVDYYNQLAVKTEAAAQSLKKLLDSVALETLELNDYFSLLERSFNLFIEIKKDQQELIRIKNTLLQQKETIRNSNQLEETLRKILKKRVTTSNGLKVTTIDQINYQDAKHLIVLACNAQHFPKIDAKQGIIDEYYLSHLPYPKKEERFNKQLQAQNRLFQISSDATFFYSLSSYSGKSMEPSFEIANLLTNFNTKAQRYPIIEFDYLRQNKAELEDETAKALFLQNNLLKASVSSFEQYTRCPYAYYLKYGLKLYKPNLPSLSPAFVGNILHKVIENKFKDKNFDANLFLQEIFKDLEGHFFKNQLLLVQQLLSTQIQTVFELLRPIEEDHLFTSSNFEQAFSHHMDLDGRMIALRGFIDRIDYKDDAYRIIDYKSSPHRLSEQAVRNATQLQLLTYMLLNKDLQNKKPVGAYYMGLNVENTNIDNGRVKFSKPYYEETNEQSIKDNIIQQHRVHGWHLDQPELYYKSQDYVAGINKNMTARGGLYNKEILLELIETIYSDLYDQILSGKIDITPHMNPCQYCDFKTICQTSVSHVYREEYFKDIKLKGVKS